MPVALKAFPELWHSFIVALRALGNCCLLPVRATASAAVAAANGSGDGVAYFGDMTRQQDHLGI
jgi:hypothetical protein